jgi:hypothetical protein
MGGVRRHRGEEGRRREGGGVGELKKIAISARHEGMNR